MSFIPLLSAPWLAGTASPGAFPGLGAAISAHFPSRLRYADASAAYACEDTSGNGLAWATSFTFPFS